MKNSKMIALLLVLVMALGLAACGSQSPAAAPAEESPAAETPANETGSAEPIKVTVAVSISEDQLGYQALEMVKEIVEEKTGGGMVFELYANSVLGGDQEVADSVIQGNVTMGMPTVSSLASYAKELNVIDAPFLFSSAEQAYEVLDGEVGQALCDSLNTAGLQGLSFWDNGFRYLTTKKEVHVPADLANLKIRVMENEIHLAFWKALGANPSPLAYSELYTALQQGSFDAEENTLTNIQSAKFYEVQSYVIGTKHLYSPYLLYCNKDFYDSLSDEYRQILVEAIATARDWQRTQSQEAEAGLIEQLKENGMTFIDLSDEELAQYQTVLDEVYAQVAALAGEDIFNAFFDAAEAAKS